MKIKNLKINEPTIKSFITGGIALITAEVIMGIAIFSICDKDTDVSNNYSNYQENFAYINQDYNSFSQYCKTIIKDGVPTVVYKGNNISITVNKDNFEIKEYIYDLNVVDGKLKTGKIFDLNTGYMLFDYTGSLDMSRLNDYGNYDKIIENSYIINFVNIGDYIEGEKLKEWYTINEIKEHEVKILESLKTIVQHNNNNNNNYTKIKK